MDPFAGATDDPPSLHRYLYAHTNPVQNRDPSGRFTLAEGLQALSIVMRLATAAIIGYRIGSVVRLTATEEMSVEDAMWELGSIGIELGVAYVGGWVINGLVKYGAVPLMKTGQLLTQINRNRIKGKFAEQLWGGMNGLIKNNRKIAGRKPDFIRPGVWDELKYYEGSKPLSLTPQLEEMTEAAVQRNVQFNLHVIPGASVGAPLSAAVARTGGSIIYDLPRVQFDAATMFGVAAYEAADAEDFWP